MNEEAKRADGEGPVRLGEQFLPGHGHAVLCPKCGYNMQHFGDPYLVPGYDMGYAGWSGRGSVIRIRMECEENHLWELCLGFHKGESILFVRNLPRGLPQARVWR